MSELSMPSKRDSVTVVRSEHAPSRQELCTNAGASSLSVALLPVERAEWRFEDGETRCNKILPLTTSIRGERDVVWSRWNQPCRCIHLGINPVLLAEVARQEVGVPALLEPREGVHDRTVLIAALLLSDEIDGGELASNLLVQSVANVLAVHLLRHYSPAGVRLPDLQTVGLDSLRLKRVLDFIEANLETSLSLDTLADAAGVSAYHFARSFKYATSYSPHQWVVTQRINRAKILLRATRLLVADVARQVGMDNQSHYANQFRRQVGCSPSQFRASG
jgi:AraC family transcriptional regulator